MQNSGHTTRLDGLIINALAARNATGNNDVKELCDTKARHRREWIENTTENDI